MLSNEQNRVAIRIPSSGYGMVWYIYAIRMTCPPLRTFVRLVCPTKW